MVSHQGDITNFFERTQDMDYPEVILLADREATRAERMCLKGGASEDTDSGEHQKYADCLKNLIFFLRYGIRPARVPEKTYRLFQRLESSTSSREKRRIGATLINIHGDR